MLEEIKEEEEEVAGIEGTLVANMTDSNQKVTPEILSKHEDRFLEGVNSLEVEINDIVEKLEGIEEKVYELEEKESRKLSELGDEIREDEQGFEKAVETLKEILYEYIQQHSDAFNWSDAEMSRISHDVAEYDRYVSDEVEDSNHFDGETVIEDLDAIIRDLRRFHGVLANLDNIEEYDEEHTIPVLETLKSEIGRIDEEKTKLVRILDTIEEIDESSQGIQNLESKASTLVDKIDKVKEQYGIVSKRYGAERDTLLDEIDEIISLTDLYTGAFGKGEFMKIFRSGNFSHKKISNEVKEKLEEADKDVKKVRNEAKSLKNEVLDSRDAYDIGTEYAD